MKFSGYLLSTQLCRVENWERGAFCIEGFREGCIESFYFSLVCLLCTWRIHICSYPDSAEEFLLLHMRTNMYCVLSFWYRSDKCEVIPCGFFGLCFSDEYHCWASFCILVHPYVFGKMCIQFFCPFFKLLVFSFWVIGVSYIFTFWILTSYQIYGLQMFFSHSDCFFILLFLLLCRDF